MARHLIALAALGFLLTGCISQERYNSMKMEKDALAEQLGKSQASESAARAAAEAWKAQLDAILAKGGDLEAVNRALNQEVTALKESNASLSAKYEQALRDRSTVVSLPQGLVDDLTRLAQQYPDTIEFDAARGMLKFKSDVTFDKGSAVLTPQARQAIQGFARILNSPAAKGYEFLVAGHTDSTPVSNPATVRAGHLDNWYLSAHRGIAVGKELMANGVSPRRLGVAGYGDQRPIASNSTSAGQAKNRRVEVAILPTTYQGGALAGSGQDALKWSPQPAKATGPELNKDVVNLPVGPVLNK